MTNAELDQVVAEKLERWTFMVASMLKQKMRDKRVVLSKETLNSLRTKVMQGSGDITAQMLLSFNESGRMRDMNNLRYKKMPPVEMLEDYIRKVGLAKFDYVPGYDRGTMPVSQSKAINRIAWGIARNMNKNYQHKPGKWFNSVFSNSVRRLADDIATAYLEAAGQSIAVEFKKS